jgi:hypothetical protein
LACSGGGIKSASFAAGVLQGIRRAGIMPTHISCVSGGGYTGSSYVLHQAYARLNHMATVRAADGAAQAVLTDQEKASIADSGDQAFFQQMERNAGYICSFDQELDAGSCTSTKCPCIGDICQFFYRSCFGIKDVAILLFVLAFQVLVIGLACLPIAIPVAATFNEFWGDLLRDDDEDDAIRCLPGIIGIGAFLFTIIIGVCTPLGQWRYWQHIAAPFKLLTLSFAIIYFAVFIERKLLQSQEEVSEASFYISLLVLVMVLGMAQNRIPIFHLSTGPSIQC